MAGSVGRKMNKTLGHTPLVEVLAPSIKDDATIKAAAYAVDAALLPVVSAIPRMLLWARLWQDERGLSPSLRRIVHFCGGLPPLSDEELELLAWQMHVDFWDPAWPRSVREHLVKYSTAWHRIKGTAASVRKALALFGYQADIEENGPGRWWATYQLGLPDLVSLDDVRRIVSICNEMAPARSRLWRIYAGFDRRPIILTDGPALSDGWLTCYSGTRVAVDDTDSVVVSFGSRRGFTSEQLYPADLAAGMQATLRYGTLCPCVDRFILGRSRLTTDRYPRNHGFVVGHLSSIIWAKLQTVSCHWGGPWRSQPWQIVHGWDRSLPHWHMARLRRVPRSQIVLSCPPDGQHTGTLGDSNARLSRTYATTFDGYGRLSAMRLSQPVRREVQELTLMTHQRHAFALAAVSDEPTAQPYATISGNTALGTLPLHDLRWRGPWLSRRWWPYVAETNITSTED